MSDAGPDPVVSVEEMMAPVLGSYGEGEGGEAGGLPANSYVEEAAP